MLKDLLKFTIAGVIGVYVSDAFVKPMLKIGDSPGFGADDFADGATMALAAVLIRKLF